MLLQVVLDTMKRHANHMVLVLNAYAIANPVEVAPAYEMAADSEEDIDEDDENEGGEYG